ncbi:FHA domain-containing protein [Nakamurella silvestris]|nr:FHA domain-containing protein [Nakamurella silvestris]
MRLKISLKRPDGQVSRLAVTVDGTANVGDVAHALYAADPQRSGAIAPEGLSLVTSDSLSTAAADGRPLSASTNLLEAGVRSGATVSLIQEDNRFSRPGESRGAVAAKLTVLRGPDLGKEFALPFGTTYLGRGQDVQVRLTDPLVSKRHCRLTVGDRIEVFDANSANGTLIGGTPVQRAALNSGDEFGIGDSLVSVVRLQRANTSAPSSPVVEFNRSPRVVPTLDPPELVIPDPPKEGNARRFPLVAMVAPVVMGSAMFLVTRSTLSIVFMALSPVIMMGTWFDARVNTRREFGKALEKFVAGLGIFRESAASAHQRERTIRLAQTPSVTETVGAVHRLGPLLWTHRPEHRAFLTARLGIGRLPSRTPVKVPASNDCEPEYWAEVEQVAAEFSEIDGVPVVLDLRRSGVVGIAGANAEAEAVARGIVVQLIGLHSPAELVVTALTSPRSRSGWEWLEWLPHNGSAHSPLQGDHLADNQGAGQALLARLEDLVAARRGGSGQQADLRGPIGRDVERSEEEQRAALPAVLLVVEDDCQVDRGRLTRLAERGADVGVHLLWRAATIGELPAACRTFVEIQGPSGPETVIGEVRTGTGISAVACEGLSAEAAEKVALMLAPVVDVGSPTEDASDLPRSVGILTLEGASRNVAAEAIMDRWVENNSLVSRWAANGNRQGKAADLRALIGHDGTGEFYLDLRTQGPHALVGGTTGAGKSEFLQSWILGLATGHSPERVTFLFVDYKGGAAFAECVQLPHTVGLVTDLSPHLVRRALTSLKAELRYREELFHRYGAKDLAAMEKEGHPETPPSLLIVVDEFAALVKEVPEFVDGVVDVAQRGRSLGLHLILATQRPAGVINDNLRANTNLRIALRMADVNDSVDVLGDKMAAYFDPGIPGRGAAKTGPGRITPFQTAYAGGVTTNRPAAPQIEIAEMGFGTRALWEIPKAETDETEIEGPSDISRVVAAVVEAAELAGAAAPRLPWSPVLAQTYELRRLGQTTDEKLVLGLVDDPDRQDQYPAYFEPDVDGSLAIYGAGGAGKSTAMRTIAVAAAQTPTGGPVQIYGVDFASGGLTMLETLPHVGSIISGDDSERITRLFSWLRALVDERSQRYTAVNTATIGSYRQASGRSNEPRILVLIDGFGVFRQEYDMVPGRGAVYNTFQQLLVDGRSTGVHFVLSADRVGSLPTSVASGIQRKIVLRQVDEDAYRALNVPKDVISAESPPGRAVDGGRKLELQLAVLGGTANIAEQARAIDRLGERMRAAGREQAPPIKRLPNVVLAPTLPDSVAGLPVLGVADDTLEPVGFDPAGVFIVAGPPRSGRTTAVVGMVNAVNRWRTGVRYVYFAGRRSPVADLPVWQHTARNPDDAKALAIELHPDLLVPPTDDGVGIVVVVEALSDYIGTPAEQPMTEMIRAIKRNGHFLIAEGDSSSWGSSWGLVTEVKSARRGISLQMDHIETEGLFRTPVGRVSRAELPAGRGTFVNLGTSRRVQLPTPS